MKFTGGVLVWLALVALGACKAKKLNERERLIYDILSMLSKIKSDVKYYALPLPSIIDKLSECSNEFLKKHFKKCSESLDKGTGFTEAWKEAGMTSMAVLSHDEFESFCSLGEQLSSKDSETLLASLDASADRFEMFFNRAVKEREKYSRLALFSGVFLGGIVFILVL